MNNEHIVQTTIKTIETLLQRLKQSEHEALIRYNETYKTNDTSAADDAIDIGICIEQLEIAMSELKFLKQ